MTSGGSRTMPPLETAELTMQERGILATSASATYPDHFSETDRRLISAYQQPAPVVQKRTYYSRGQTWVIEWQDYMRPLPAWFDARAQGFVGLLSLPPAGDSRGAGAIVSALAASWSRCRR